MMPLPLLLQVYEWVCWWDMLRKEDSQWPMARPQKLLPSPMALQISKMCQILGGHSIETESLAVSGLID